jgi:urea carboxylase
MGPDGPSLGGYAKIATVISADLRRLGQVRPGETVRFRAVRTDEAVKALREADALVDEDSIERA